MRYPGVPAIPGQALPAGVAAQGMGFGGVRMGGGSEVNLTFVVTLLQVHMGLVNSSTLWQRSTSSNSSSSSRLWGSRHSMGQPLQATG